MKSWSVGRCGRNVESRLLATERRAWLLLGVGGDVARLVKPAAGARRFAPRRFNTNVRITTLT